MKLAQKGEFLLAEEYGTKIVGQLDRLLVDTGPFLDHRIARSMLRKMSRGTNFLNLFAYTDNASIHTGMGGARAAPLRWMCRAPIWSGRKNLHSNNLVAVSTG